MLVFTRRRDEAVVIGEGIEVRVLRTGKHAVRLGVSAPSDIAVHRREVYDAVCAANQSAASVAVTSIEHLAGRLRLHPPLEPVE